MKNAIKTGLVFLVGVACIFTLYFWAAERANKSELNQLREHSKRIEAELERSNSLVREAESRASLAENELVIAQGKQREAENAARLIRGELDRARQTIAILAETSRELGKQLEAIVGVTQELESGNTRSEEILGRLETILRSAFDRAGYL